MGCWKSFASTPRRHGWWCLVLMACSWPPLTTQGDEASDLADAAARRIDSILESAWQSASVAPAPRCSDEQFLRRVCLDLLGRIPTMAERRDFLADPDRGALVNRLLESSEFPAFLGDVWTTQLFGYDRNDTDRATLANWLTEQIAADRPYDAVVTELLTSTGESAFNGPVNFLLRYPDEPVVKVSRAFLGVRLDCARCHDHPFDRWTQHDFQRMNRFFDATERREISGDNIQLIDVVRDVSPDERPRFLTGAEPRTSQWRAEFALFLTRSRPFARNFVNRQWYHLLGRGIVHPVDDVSAANPAAVPALLEALADEAMAQRFSTKQLIRLICRTQAYQLASADGQPDSERQRLFAVRSIKPLTPEQWYASLCVATDRAPSDSERLDLVRQFLGDDLNSDYSATWEYRETVQGLMGRLVDPVKLPSRSTDELFVRFLGRLPTDKERQLCQGQTAEAVTFVLLHSSQFAFNH